MGLLRTAIVLIVLLLLIVSLPFLFNVKNGQTRPLQNKSGTVPLIQLPLPKLANNTAVNLPPEPSYSLVAMEKRIHDLINRERTSRGLSPLNYNDDIASVARDHSIYLAKENEPLTDPSIYCHEIFIHHEGFDFGLYHYDRLQNRSIYYFSSAGENIFMTSTWSYLETNQADLPECANNASEVEQYPSLDAVRAELQQKLDYSKSAIRVNWTSVGWQSQDELGDVVVSGWMNSTGHRKNILDPSFNEEGIGVAKVNNFIIVTEDLIGRVDCGYKDAGCCKEPGYFYCYEPWQCGDDLTCR